jgi:hypothetical protein
MNDFTKAPSLKNINNMHICPKCGKHGFVWDARAKVYRCLYHGCNHVIRLPKIKE